MRFRLAAVPAALAVGALCLGSPLAAAAEEVPIPVLGQTLSANSEVDGRLVITLHGVRRIEGGTAVYYSVGFPASAKNTDSLSVALSLTPETTVFFPDQHGEKTADVALVDTTNLKLYGGLKPGDGVCVCSQDGLGYGYPYTGKPGEADVLYSVTPALPEGVDKVSVFLADRVFPDIPVEDGPMTPETAVTQDSPVIKLGTGWPKINPSRVAQADPTASTFNLTERIADLENVVATRKQAKQQAVDVNADVLFVVDKADVSAKGKASLQKAAAELKRLGAKGTVTVTGHTDSDGDDAYNLALSKRRAEAVVAVLQPMLGSGITLRAEGKGETEPVASNDSKAGKALNRRVSLSFSTGGN